MRCLTLFWSVTLVSSPLVRIWEPSAALTRLLPVCRPSMARCVSQIQASVRRPSSDKPLAWPCEACDLSRKCSIWITCCTHYKFFPMIWRPCTGVPKAGRRPRSLSARAVTAWKASGTRVRRWRVLSTWFAAYTCWCHGT